MRSRASKGSELTHAELDANFVRDVKIKTTTYAALVSDNHTTIEGNHGSTPFTVTLGDAATMAAAETGDYEVTIANIGAAAVTVARAGSDTIDGVATSIVLQQYSSMKFKVNAAGDGYNTGGRGGLGQLTATVAELNYSDISTLGTAEASKVVTTDSNNDSAGMNSFTAGTVNADGDTSAGDNAAMGYTSTEGLILTGQGSNNDITLKNDADADVLTVATGTTTITLPGALSVDDTTDSTSGTTGSIHTDGGLGVAKDIHCGATVNAAGDTSAGDNAVMGYTATEGLILTGQGSQFDITIKNDADANVLTVPTGTIDVTLTGVVTVGSHLQVSSLNSLTASSGSAQGGTPLVDDLNEISICGTTGDSVTLPTANFGRRVTIINNGANAADVFPASSDNLGAGVDTAASLAAGSNITYAAYSTTNWVAVT